MYGPVRLTPEETTVDENADTVAVGTRLLLPVLLFHDKRYFKAA